MWVGVIITEEICGMDPTGVSGVGRRYALGEKGKWILRDGQAGSSRRPKRSSRSNVWAGRNRRVARFGLVLRFRKQGR